MIINSIELKNYRCFKEAKFDFSVNGKMDLVIGVIGTGKTELLFSIFWVLYDFDFKNLKNKENTPYSLNEKLYNSVLYKTSLEESCSVTLDVHVKFGDSMRRMRIKKSEFFSLGINNKMNTRKEYEISKYSLNGEKELPIKDPGMYVKEIEKIIPKKILNGILFDGERMRNLSTNEKSSIDTIESIISDITNRSLLEKLKIELESLRKEYSKERIKVSKKSGGDVNSLLQVKEDKIFTRDNLKSKLEKLRNKCQILLESQTEIENQLQLIADTAHIINRKKEIQKELKNIKEQSEETLDDFSNKLRYGFLLPMESIFSEAKSLVDNYKVPKGLNVEAVLSILEGDICICGNHLSDESRVKLTSLVQELPPDNLNATIGEMINQNKSKRKNYIEDYRNIYNRLDRQENRIRELNDELAEIEKNLGSFDDSQINDLNKNYKDVNIKIGELNNEINREDKRLSDLNRDIQELEDEVIEKTQNDDDISKVTKYINLIEKYLKLTESIIEHNKSVALNEINELINKGFSLISEDYNLGRRVYITQYSNPKYKLVPFYNYEYERIKKSLKINELQSKYSSMSLEDERQLHEALVLEAATSSSTGQAKINTLSFVYAIMQYTLIERGTETIHLNKQYPLLIDAPLSEISGGSLELISKNLPMFNKQVIVMIDDNSYENSKSHYQSQVGYIYRLDKTSENLTTVVRREKWVFMSMKDTE